VADNAANVAAQINDRLSIPPYTTAVALTSLEAGDVAAFEVTWGWTPEFEVGVIIPVNHPHSGDGRACREDYVDGDDQPECARTGCAASCPIWTARFIWR
jgi:hypothetical protein